MFLRAYSRCTLCQQLLCFRQQSKLLSVMLKPSQHPPILSTPISIMTGLQHECVWQSSPHQMQDRSTSSEWTGGSAKWQQCRNYDAKLLSKFMNASHLFAISLILMHLYHRLSCGTSNPPQEGACISRWRSNPLTFQSVPVVCSQGNESEYHATILFLSSIIAQLSLW